MNSNVRQDVCTEIANFFGDRYDLDAGRMSEETSLFDGEGGLGVDSLDLVSMAQVLQDKYDINLDDERLTSVQTIGDLVAFVEDKMAEAA
jgi:acyl carrier protein